MFFLRWLPCWDQTNSIFNSIGISKQYRIKFRVLWFRLFLNVNLKGNQSRPLLHFYCYSLVSTAKSQNIQFPRDWEILFQTGNFTHTYAIFLSFYCILNSFLFSSLSPACLWSWRLWKTTLLTLEQNIFLRWQYVTYKKLYF